jgi:phage/plasmid-associated DNA primase
MVRANNSNGGDSTEVNNDNNSDSNGEHADVKLGEFELPKAVVNADDRGSSDDSNDGTDPDAVTEPGTGLTGTTCRVCGEILDTVKGRKSHETQKHPDDALENAIEDIETDDDGDDPGAGQSIITADDVEAAEDDGGEDLEDRAKEREKAGKDASRFWEDARDAYEDASLQGSPASKRDAREIVIDALTRETSFMSVRERCDESHTDLWRWTTDNGWTDDAFTFIEERMEAEVGKYSGKQEVKKIVHSIGARNRVAEDSLNGGDVEGTLIPVANGVIRLEDVDYNPDTMTIDHESVELEEMQKEHRFTYRIQTRWDPGNADFEGYDAWVDEITQAGRPGDVRVLHEFVGHALHERFPADGFLVLLGDGGSGKSQWLEAVRETVGEDNACPVSIHEIENERFAGVHVVDSRVNISTELDGVDLDSISKLKTFSAGESTKVAKKGVDPYFSKNDAAMMFASDDPPAITADNNRALSRRVYPIEFPMSYVPDPDPGNPYELKARGKLAVQDMLRADDRLQALLVRGVEGLKRLIEEEGFTAEGSRDERLARYNSYADPIKDFRRVCLVDAGPESQIESGVMMSVFDAFAAAKDHPGKSQQQISSVLDGLQGISFTKGRTRSWSDEQSKHTVYTGLKFSKEAIRHYVPDHAYEHLDLSALHDDEGEDTRDAALDEVLNCDGEGVNNNGDDEGGIDIDTHPPDTPAEQHVYDMVNNLEDEFDGGVPGVDVIEALADETDIDREEYRDALQDLAGRGQLYEKATGRWRAT